MRAFSQLLDDLVYTRSRNGKLRLIGSYLKQTPDPDRGLALAALTGTLDIPAVKPAVVRALAELRIDPVLWTEIERLAAQDLRSANAQVEFLLREALARRGRLPARAGDPVKKEHGR